MLVEEHGRKTATHILRLRLRSWCIVCTSSVRDPICNAGFIDLKSPRVELCSSHYRALYRAPLLLRNKLLKLSVLALLNSRLSQCQLYIVYLIC